MKNILRSFLALCIIFASITATRRSFSSLLKRPMQNRLVGGTNLLDQCSTALQISQPWNAPRWVWTLAWKIQSKMIPILHYFDKCAAKDNNLNLAVLWWKAMSGNRIGSTTFDNFIAYDLLPPISRFIVALPFCWLYPKLHHQNVALRTAFLDKSLLQVLDEDVSSRDQSIDKSNENDSEVSPITPRVITLGAGFDTRSLRFKQPNTENNLINGKSFDTFSASAFTSSGASMSSGGNAGKAVASSLDADFYEVDLPSVVSQKENIFKRYLQRRPNSIIPKLYGADLNQIHEVKRQLALIFADSKAITKNMKNEKSRPTVFIIEAVLMYLKEENIMPLLSTVMAEAAKHSSSVHLCFADRLPGMPHNDADLEVERIAAIDLLRSVGLDLTTWQPKPGRARHMGIAKYTMQ